MPVEMRAPRPPVSLGKFLAWCFLAVFVLYLINVPIMAQRDRAERAAWVAAHPPMKDGDLCQLCNGTGWANHFDHSDSYVPGAAHFGDKWYWVDGQVRCPGCEGTGRYFHH